MFDEPLPKQADLRKYTAKQATFNARLPLSCFPRFASSLAASGKDEDSVVANLQFDVDNQRHRTLIGDVDCEVSVICQRCMQPMRIHIHADIALAVVWDEEQAQQLPKSFDPLIVAEDELVDMNEILEDELLLAMPYVSYHNLGECEGKQSYESTSDQVIKALAEAETENPFSVLGQLKADD
jgi:uncharacterized protein